MKRYVFIALIALAVLIRFVCMPVSLHTDLLFVNYFPSFFSLHGIWDGYGAFGDQFSRQGDTYYAPLVYYTVGFFQKLFEWADPNFAALMSRLHESVRQGVERSLSERIGWFPPGQWMRSVFIMKLPYFIAEMCALLLFLKCFDKKVERKKAALFWLWNPVLIFSSYIFGQYRMYVVFFITLLMYFVKRGPAFCVWLALGMLCLTDNFPFLLILPLALLRVRSRKEAAVSLAALALPLLFILCPLIVSSGGLVLHAYVSPTIHRLYATSIFRHYPETIGPALKAVFMAGYAAMILSLVLNLRNQAPHAGEQRVLAAASVCASVLLLFYATTTALAHYFMWVTPFLLYIQVKEKGFLRHAVWGLLLLLFMFNLDSRELNLGLFLPLFPEAMRWPSLHEIMNRYMPWGTVIASCRLLFSVLSVIYAWRIWRAKVSCAVSHPC